MQQLKSNYLDVIIEYAPTAIAIFDKEMNYVMASKWWLELFNLNESIIGKNHYQVFPGIKEEWKLKHKEALQGKSVKTMNEAYVTSEGKKIYCNWEVRPWFDKKNGIGGVIIICEDITERKIQEKLKLEEEKKFQAIFDQAAVGITQVSPDGRYVRANRKFCEMIGYSEEELLEKTFIDITHPDDVEIDLDLARTVLGKEIDTYDLEKRYIKKNGNILWAHLTVSVVKDEKGDPKHFISTAQDISKRKKIEEALLESEQKFKIVFDQTAMGMVLVGLDGHIIAANNKSCSILGYSRTELLSLSFQEFTYPPDLQEDLDLLEKLKRGEISNYSLEKRYIRKDKSLIWGSLFVSLVRDPSNEPLYFIAAVHDISERKIAEEELKKTRQELEMKIKERTVFLSLLQKISSEANHSTDICHTLSMSLNEICKLTGWQIGHFYPVESETIGRIEAEDLWCLHDKVAYQPFVDASRSARTRELHLIHEVIRNGKPYWKNNIFKGGLVNRSKQGLAIGLKAGLGFPVLIGDEVVAVMEFFSTQTINPAHELIDFLTQAGTQLGRLLERQKSQQEIRLRESRLQAIIDNIPARIYLKDTQGKYLIVNKIFEEFFEKTKPELIGKTAFDVFDREEALKWTKFDEAIVSTGQMVAFEVVHQKRNEEPRTYLLTKFPVRDSQGQIYGFGGISQDITDEKRSDQRIRGLLQSEHDSRTEAERAIQSRDEFISIASHELKSPITALKMKTQLIHRQLVTDPNSLKTDKVSGMINKLDKDADRLVLLINRLLDMTRIQSGKLELNLEPVNLSELIHNMIDSHALQLEESKCELQLDVEENVTGMWDRSRLEQVVVNLLTNAMKFGEHKPIKIVLKQDTTCVLIKFQDSGKGIAKENQEKIFERFERGDPKEGVQGLGLGLYIVRQILEAHGGSIKVESEPGKGSSFIVELPQHKIDRPHDRPSTSQYH